MPRWEPNARDRLADAAIRLFAERGYEQTTVDDIAEAAGLTRSTFFRHFRDKREPLFAGRDGLTDDIERAVATAPPGTTLLAAVTDALAGLGADWFTEERRRPAGLRATVIDATEELRERELLKAAALSDAVARGATRRGASEIEAATLGAVAGQALSRAVGRWHAPGSTEDFGDAVRAETDAVVAAVRSLR